jgi:hypothetical protein
LKEVGDDGMCGPVAAGKDPHDDCADQGACSCRNDGACDGAGACRLYKKGTECGACSGGATAGYVCDGLGVCGAPKTVECDGDHTLLTPDGPRSCFPYRCSSAIEACFQTCGSSDECAAPAVCNARGACVPPPAPPSVVPPTCGAAPASRESAGGGAVIALVAALGIRRARRRGAKGRG